MIVMGIALSVLRFKTIDCANCEVLSPCCVVALRELDARPFTVDVDRCKISVGVTCSFGEDHSTRLF